MARWTDRLKERWNVTSTMQVFVILLVFALTGTTVAMLAKPLLRTLFEPAEVPLWARVVYWILILPIYNLFLVLYGAILGQFNFFWNFEKRFFTRLFGKRTDKKD